MGSVLAKSARAKRLSTPGNFARPFEIGNFSKIFLDIFSGAACNKRRLSAHGGQNDPGYGGPCCATRASRHDAGMAWGFLMSRGVRDQGFSRWSGRNGPTATTWNNEVLPTASFRGTKNSLRNSEWVVCILEALKTSMWTDGLRQKARDRSLARNSAFGASIADSNSRDHQG